MNKGELVASIVKKLDVSRKKAETILSATLSSIVGGLKKDGNVRLIGFGSLNVRKRAARNGRNPQTGKSIKIPAKKTVVFKAGKKLKESIK